LEVLGQKHGGVSRARSGFHCEALLKVLGGPHSAIPDHSPHIEPQPNRTIQASFETDI
jgi:hypothetical protein